MLFRWIIASRALRSRTRTGPWTGCLGLLYGPGCTAAQAGVSTAASGMAERYFMSLLTHDDLAPIGPWIDPAVPNGTPVFHLEDLLVAHLNPPAPPSDPSAAVMQSKPSAPPPPPAKTGAAQATPVVKPTPKSIAADLAAVKFDPKIAAKVIVRTVARSGEASDDGTRYYRFEQDPGGGQIQTYDPVYCRANISNSDLDRAFRLYCKIRNPDIQLGSRNNLLLPPDGGTPEPFVDPEEYSFGFWVNYLYSEVPSSAIRTLVHYLLRDGTGPMPVPLQTSSRDGRYILTILRRAAYVTLPTLSDAERGRRLAAFSKELSRAKSLDGRLMAFHCTGREPEKLLKTGTIRTVAIPGKLDEFAAKLPWHPYSEEMGYRGEPLFRLQSGDNDLYTTVSIAQTPVEGIDFPLVSAMLNALLDQPDIPGGVQDCVRARTLPPNGEYVNKSGQKITVRRNAYVTECWVYVVAVTNPVWDTRALQTKSRTSDYTSASSEVWLKEFYPGGQGELATDVIPVDDHLLAIRYERTHFGPTREDGMRYRILEARVLPGAAGLALAYLPVDIVPVLGVKRGVGMSDAAYRDQLLEAKGSLDASLSVFTTRLGSERDLEKYSNELRTTAPAQVTRDRLDAEIAEHRRTASNLQYWVTRLDTVCRQGLDDELRRLPR